MSDRVVEVPADVRQTAVAQGVTGARWLERLGVVIEELECDWLIRVGAALDGGSDAFVAEATTSDGRSAIFKLALPGEGRAHEIETLLRADGLGYVRLLRYDVPRQAMLQERLGVALGDLGMPVMAQIRVICETLRQAWEVRPDPCFPSGGEKARALAEFIVATWEELNRPCSGRVIDRAMEFVDARVAAFDPDIAVLVHGDAHAANTLVVPRQPDSPDRRFKFVDPDGLFAERACDLAVPMRDWSRALLDGDALQSGRERCAYLSRLTRVDVQPIWEWGFIERVSTGLLALRVGREHLGRDTLAVAEAFSAVGRI